MVIPRSMKEDQYDDADSEEDGNQRIGRDPVTETNRPRVREEGQSAQ